MVLDSIRNLIADKEPTPNKFTIAMGELIRDARNEAGLSQIELAHAINRRQATLSDMENGKAEVSTGTLLLLAAALDKPITYFFPNFVYQELKPEKFTALEHELIDTFRSILYDNIKGLTVDLVKVIAIFDPTNLFEESLENLTTTDERYLELIKLLERRHKIFDEK